MEPSATSGPVSKGKTSKYRGVCWNKRDVKWVSQLTGRALQGMSIIHLGAFHGEAGEIAAAEAYDAAAFFVMGSSAKLNFPERFFNLKPGQVPPSIQDKVPSKIGRKHLEDIAACARADVSDKSQPQKRKRDEANVTQQRAGSQAGAGPSARGSPASGATLPDAPEASADGPNSTGIQPLNSARQPTAASTGDSSFDKMVMAFNVKQAKSAALDSVKKEQEALFTQMAEVEAKVNSAKEEYARLLRQQLDSLSSSL
ncbi:hypothetical protein DUNSADRAFT_1589 [Dunaliella salina]|uniref:AP2/ERF domain-containing protein n=1 Tax=Dunaliella salina TaxID=3046 RepID=A0ABQ7H8I4_DUNSA|nr:hypothetical protein DUNSADRAFT_1589 [Dunaliella salina]|eukprot:KAF5843162.1 hypothetical protein DUNSADRAFT_1589 [Dunaliella salina]